MKWRFHCQIRPLPPCFPTSPCSPPTMHMRSAYRPNAPSVWPRLGGFKQHIGVILACPFPSDHHTPHLLLPTSLPPTPATHSLTPVPVLFTFMLDLPTVPLLLIPPLSSRPIAPQATPHTAQHTTSHPPLHTAHIMQYLAWAGTMSLIMFTRVTVQPNSPPSSPSSKASTSGMRGRVLRDPSIWPICPGSQQDPHHTHLQQTSGTQGPRPTSLSFTHLHDATTHNTAQAFLAWRPEEDYCRTNRIRLRQILLLHNAAPFRPRHQAKAWRASLPRRAVIFTIIISSTAALTFQA